METVDFTILTAILCILTLGIMMLLTFSKLRKDFSEPKGSPAKGIAYALTFGMLPGAKESASQHLTSYLAGILFHIGIFASFLSTAIIYFGLNDTLIIPDWPLYILMGLIAIGLLNGLGLLIKRIINQRLRALSHFDDYFSNILVNVFLAAAMAALIGKTETAYNFMYLIEGILFLYIPLGKLRHCAYFFATRIMFGMFYGHRGVLNKIKAG
ncbi:MAG: hypothetical protein HY811_11380 [Planctomycetes bacterium]|nr:hypothetical protein [Planctomycetota bacterium]